LPRRRTNAVSECNRTALSSFAGRELACRQHSARDDRFWHLALAGDDSEAAVTAAPLFGTDARLLECNCRSVVGKSRDACLQSPTLERSAHRHVRPAVTNLASSDVESASSGDRVTAAALPSRATRLHPAHPVWRRRRERAVCDDWFGLVRNPPVEAPAGAVFLAAGCAVSSRAVWPQPLSSLGPSRLRRRRPHRRPPRRRPAT